MDKLELTTLVHQLIGLGEDPGELNYWLEIFDYLEPTQQILLCANLQRELKSLQ